MCRCPSVHMWGQRSAYKTQFTSFTKWALDMHAHMCVQVNTHRDRYQMAS